MQPARPAAILLILPLLGGCLSAGDYPSLARRPIETQRDAPPTPPPATSALSVEDRARVAALVEQHRAADARFATLTAGIPAGGPVGGEAWAAAQVAISRAGQARAPSTEALVELDRLYIHLLDAEAQGGPAGPATEVATARVAVANGVAAQADRLAALAAALPD